LTLLSAAALGGCDLAPRYRLPTTSVPAQYAEQETFQIARPADNSARGPWWVLFGDPQLNMLEAQLDTANPNLSVALESFKRAQALAAQANAGLYPQVNLGRHVYYDRQSDNRPLRGAHQPNEFLDSTISAAATYEIDLWGRVANQIRSGRAAAQASAADLQSISLSLHAELASSYAALRGYDAEAEVLTKAVNAYGQSLQLTQNRFTGKISSGIDVSRAEQQLASAQAALSDIAEKRALAVHAVAVLVGRVPAQLHIEPKAPAMRLPDISPGLPSTLLERRPDVAAAEREMAAANAQIGVARAAFYPSFSLNAMYGFQNTAVNPFSLRDELWSLGPGLAMPLFEGGLRHAELAAALAAYRQTVGEYRQTVLTAYQQVEDALAALHWLGQETRQEQAAVDAARHSVQMATNLYKDGATSFLDVVVAQTAELQSEQALADLRTRRMQAAVSLVRALGGGWSIQDLPDAKTVAKLAISP
jgi:NodT family efflux transporter outer membrane factor (OMF) lipoprotein